MRSGVNPPASPFQIVHIYEKLVGGEPPKEIMVDRIVKETVEVESPLLMAEFKRVSHENAELKRFQRAPEVVEKIVEVERIVEVPSIEFREIIQKELDTRLIAIITFVSALTGILSGFLFWGK